MVEMEEAEEAEVVEADIKTKEVAVVAEEVEINTSNIKGKIKIHSLKIVEATLNEITSQKVINISHKLNSNNSNRILNSTNHSLSSISLLTMIQHSNTILLRIQNSTKIDIKIKISTKIKIDTKIKITIKIKIDTKITIKSTTKSKDTILIMTNNIKMISTDMNNLATSEITVMSMAIRMDIRIIIRRFLSIKTGKSHTNHKAKAKSNIMVNSRPMHLQKNSARIR